MLQEQRAGKVVMVVLVVDDLGRGRAEIGDSAEREIRKRSVFGRVS